MIEHSSDDWTRDEVEAELANVLSDPEFERNPSVSRFLAFVVAETLEGRGARLKAFTIAVAVFGRDETFDAQNNSIVRVQAARLRQLLDAYYAGPGAGDPIRIEMPVGAYRLVISKSAAAPQNAPAALQDADAALQGAPAILRGAPAASPQALTPLPDAPNTIRPAPPPGLSRLTVVALIAAALFAGLALWLANRPCPPGDWTRGRPTVSLRVASGAGAESAVLARLSDGLSRALGAFDSLIVTRSAAESRRETPGAYDLIVNAPASSRAPRLSIDLLHKASGAVVWTGDYAAPVDEEGEAAVIASAARAIADTHGALNMDMMRRARPWPPRPTGHLCILASVDAITHRLPEDVRRAFDCLEADIAAEPDNAYAQALLAALLVRRYLDAAPGALGSADLTRATRLARESFDRDPQRARSAYALFLTRFYDKRFEEAFVAARRTLELNPNVTLFAAQIGASYISRGDYARGETLLAPLSALDRAAPSFFNAFTCLAAFMRDDEARFRSLARAVSMENGSIGLILRAIAAHRAGDREAVREAAQKLGEKFPGVAADVPAAFDRYALAPDIVAKLTGQWRAVQADLAAR